MKNNIRQQESLKPFIQRLDESKFTQDQILILCSSTDNGVIKNSGRNGARFAPKALIHALEKLNNHSLENNKHVIYTQEVSNDEAEKKHFEKAQDSEAELIMKYHNKLKPRLNIHLGGGHDHIYPYLCALELNPEIEEIFVLNIDAHCDTRVAPNHHSGTPFRDFAQKTEKKFQLIQYGIQDYSNSPSTLSQLPNANVEYLYISQLLNENESFQPEILEQLFFKLKITNKTKSAFVLSLDCDAIDGSQMPAVSCVNPNGISMNHLSNLISFIQTKKFKNLHFGVYEFNPVYDSLSNLGSKSIATLLYQVIK